MKTTATIEWTWTVMAQHVTAWHGIEGREDFTAGCFFLLHWSLLNLQWCLWTLHSYKADLPDVLSGHGRVQADMQANTITSQSFHLDKLNNPLCLFTSSKRLQTRVIFLTPCFDDYQDDEEHFHESNDKVFNCRPGLEHRGGNRQRHVWFGFPRLRCKAGYHT